MYIYKHPLNTENLITNVKHFYLTDNVMRNHRNNIVLFEYLCSLIIDMQNLHYVLKLKFKTLCRMSRLIQNNGQPKTKTNWHKKETSFKMKYDLDNGHLQDG